MAKQTPELKELVEAMEATTAARNALTNAEHQATCRRFEHEAAVTHLNEVLSRHLSAEEDRKQFIRQHQDRRERVLRDMARKQGRA